MCVSLLHTLNTTPAPCWFMLFYIKYICENKNRSSKSPWCCSFIYAVSWPDIGERFLTLHSLKWLMSGSISACAHSLPELQNSEFHEEKNTALLSKVSSRKSNHSFWFFLWGYLNNSLVAVIPQETSSSQRSTVKQYESGTNSTGWMFPITNIYIH